MPFSSLTDLALETPLRIRLIRCGDEATLSFAGLAHPLRLAAAAVGPSRLLLDVVGGEDIVNLTPDLLPQVHVVLLISDTDLPDDAEKRLLAHGRAAGVCGAVGSAVGWLIRAGEMQGLRAAIPPSLDAHAAEFSDRTIVSTRLFELDGKRLTCCGGAASADFALTLIKTWFGAALQSKVMEALCIEHVREAGERSRHTLPLQPAVAEALQLMEANIEEPLNSDDIANLVGVSRRQLERLFKQHLGNMPARYYLELRLQRGRALLLESHHSIVQVGLMCGFSSGAHFATAYGALYGISPREERQRRLTGMN